MGDSTRLCGVDGCTRKYRSAGYCALHYSRVRKYGDPGPVESMRAPLPETCSVEGCSGKAERRSWCQKHYYRWRKYGDPTGRPPKPSMAETEARFWSKVDKTPSCWLWTDAEHKSGYGHFKIEGHHKKAHRVSWEFSRGKIPDGLVVDHICHVKLCVNPEHLRLATPKQNAEYRKGPMNDHTSSGVRGVSRSGNAWIVRVIHNYKRYYFGSYSNLQEAEAVAIRARADLFDFPEFKGDTTPTVHA